MQPHPYQNLHWYPLTSSKNIWPTISVAYFTKWFQSVCCWWVENVSFQSPLIGPCLHIHSFGKGPHFEAWTRPEPEITSPNPARGRHLFWKPNLGLKVKFTEGVLRYAQLWSNKKRCVQVQLQVHGLSQRKYQPPWPKHGHNLTQT